MRSDELPSHTPVSYTHLEPVIPRTTDLTLIVFGCAGVGKPLTEQFVHRTDLFSEVIGKEKGEHVEFGDLIALLRSGHFFKGIPRTSRIAVIFNQVDLLPDSLSSNDTLRQWAEDALAISPIDAVFFTSGAGDAHRTEFGLVRTETDSPLFSAVVLAAGLSERMGEENKLLLPLGNTTVLEQTLSRVLKSDIRELIVVLGHEATKVEQSATAAIGTKTPPTMQIKTVFNEHYESGQGTSCLLYTSMDLDVMDEKGIDPLSDCLTEERYRKLFGTNRHAFTGVDYVEYYRDIIEAEGALSLIHISLRAWRT